MVKPFVVFGNVSRQITFHYDRLIQNAFLFNIQAYVLGSLDAAFHWLYSGDREFTV